MKIDEPWQITAARYCVENSEKGFSVDNLKKFVKSRYFVSDSHIQQFIEEELELPSGRKFSRTGRGGSWIPPLDLVSKITDYDELKEARRNSIIAFRFSLLAIVISAFASMLQFIDLFLNSGKQ